MQDIFGGMLNFIEQAISTDSGCLNCLSNDHKVEQCPHEGAVEWMNLLIGVRDGINVRNSAESSDMVIDLVGDDIPDSRPGNIAFHDESRSLIEIVGETEIANTYIGGKDPRKMGYRRQGYLYDAIREHMKETQYIPQMGHTSAVDQTGMTKYQNWTTQVRYGKIVAIEARMAVFADPAWGDCRFDTKMLREPDYNHATLQDYTRRWNKVLRHDIGHMGPSARCDEMGWVSVEEFIRNDHAWPNRDRKAYDYRTGRYDEKVIQDRRGLLMEGYWYTLNCRPVKRRLLIVAQIAVPADMPKIMELEDGNVYDAQRMVECGGLVRPIAIRATSGHSLSGDHKYPLAVNVDFEGMNVKFTKELAFKLAGGYHVTKVDSLLSIIQKGIIPGGGSGGRDHAFFGEHAPWDHVNSCTLSYLGHDNENLLVLYVPVSRLLKYRSNFTYNADVIVRDVVPFHEVQEAWIIQRSLKKGMTARNPRKITSNKIVDEVVCQCEYAVRTVPPAIFRIVMDDLIKEAERMNRDDVVLGLEGRWAPYNDNPRDGTAAANLGAQLVLARYDLFPELCARNRMCPNCTLECPKTLLSCPQCKGQFISSGIVNRSAPVDVVLTKEELDRMVKEREESLKRAKFPKEEEIAEQEAIVIPDDPPEATFATGDVSMGGQLDDDTREEVQEAVVDADDEFTSYAINQERMNADLADYDEGSAFSVDPNERISRFILFKIADFVVNAYPPWHRFRFEENDKSRVELMKEGVRPDITGSGHMMLLADPGVGGYDMEDGVPKTADDEFARRHYQAKFGVGNSNYDGDEMLRRYRFSVVITKLLEALYRRGYDLEGEFKGMVKVCNSVREDQEKETTNPRQEVLKAIVTVEKAMGEAIKIAMKAESYSFFSQVRAVGQYVFDLKDLQSYIVSKARGKITSELAHVMHYYDVDPVPSFQALIASKSKESKPLKLKFLSDTPLQLHRGLNMLMPAPTTAEAAPQQDEPMAIATEEGPVAMEVEVVAELATPSPPPPPPMAPIIEDYDEKMEQAAEETDLQSDRIVSTVIVEDEKKEEDENIGYAGGSARGPPVILTPARPESDQPSQDSFVPPRPKAMPKASTEKTTDQIHKESEETSRTTKMTILRSSKCQRGPRPKLDHHKELDLLRLMSQVRIQPRMQAWHMLNIMGPRVSLKSRTQSLSKSSIIVVYLRALVQFRSACLRPTRGWAEAMQIIREHMESNQ